MGNCCATEKNTQHEAQPQDEQYDKEQDNAARTIQARWKNKHKKNDNDHQQSQIDTNQVNVQGSIYGGGKIASRSEKVVGNMGGNPPNPDEASPTDSFPEMNKKLKNIYTKLKNTDFTKHLRQSDETQPVLGPYKYKRGEVYVGQYKFGKRQGKGRQIWSDSTYYEGTWYNDMADGYGFLIHDTGDYYIGEWKEEKAHGYGEYTSIDGAV